MATTTNGTAFWVKVASAALGGVVLMLVGGWVGMRDTQIETVSELRHQKEEIDKLETDGCEPARRLENRLSRIEIRQNYTIEKVEKMSEQLDRIEQKNSN